MKSIVKPDLQSTLLARGPMLARQLESRRAPIVAAVAAQLAAAFPCLGWSATPTDTPARRIASVQATTLRLHQLIQLVLRSGALSVFAREYQWLWGLVRREGITGEQLRAQARWYITAARSAGAPDPADQALPDALGCALDASSAQLEGATSP